jgi:anti-sigma regulatory factor (Ser/Thr protein kinase)
LAFQAPPKRTPPRPAAEPSTALGSCTFLVRGGPRAAATIREAIDGAVPSDAQPQVLLLLSELVNNAVVHGGVGPDGWVRVAIVRSTDHLHVEVRDDGPGFAWRAQPRVDEDDPGGFGLLLIERLAARWGVVRDEAGTAVWFDYDI